MGTCGQKCPNSASICMFVILFECRNIYTSEPISASKNVYNISQVYVSMFDYVFLKNDQGLIAKIKKKVLIST